MIGSLRLVARRAWGHSGVLLTATVTALVAAVLLVSVTVLAPGVSESALRRTLGSTQSDQASLVASTGLDEEWSDLDSLLREIVADRPGITGPITATMMGTAFTSADMGGKERLAIGSIEHVDDRATLVDGRWPQAAATPVEAVVHMAALDSLGVAVGDTFAIEPLTGDTAPVEVTVVGTYTPNDPDDRVWSGYGAGVRPPEGADFTVIGPVLVTGDDLIDGIGAHSSSASWHVPLLVDTITLGNAEEIATELDSMAIDLSNLRAGDIGQQMSVSGRSATLIRTASDAASSARALLLVVVAMLTVLGLWALAFTARLVASRRAPATALMRARGADERHLLGWSLAGSAGPAVAIAVSAPALAELALEPAREQGPSGGYVEASAFGPAGWLVAAAVAAVWLTLMVAADLRAGRSITGVAAESARPRRAAAQRVGLDVVVVALGLLGLQQLRRPPETAPEIVLIIAPSLVVLAGTVVLIRALPWVAGAFAAAAGRGRGAAAMLAATETSRRSVRYAAASVLVVLAITVSVFAATTQSTWDQYSADTVDLTAPADVRVRVSVKEDLRDQFGEIDSIKLAKLEAHLDDVESDLIALPGVESAMRVLRMSFIEGAGTVDVVGIDPTSPAAALRWNERLAGGNPDAKLREIADPGGSTDPLPILATPAFAELFGLSVGDETPLEIVSGRPTDIRLAGLVDTVPGSSAAAAAMTDAFAFGRRLQQYAPSEWWLSTSDDGAAAAAAAPAVPDVISASTHADLAEQAGNDPAAAGLTTGLTAGLVFAGVFVLIGVVVHTVTALQSRSGEFAVIRAIGLGRRGIAGAATVEQGVLLGFSTLAGLGLGLLVSWLVVPHTVGGLAGLSDVPPLRLQVPWEIITGLGVAIVVLAAILISVQTTLTRHIDVPAVLRAGEDT